MFGPNTAQSIETSAALRRVEDQQWAANERLARSATANRPSWMARQVAALLGVVRGRVGAAPAPVSLRPAEAACEDDLFNSRGSGLMAA